MSEASGQDAAAHLDHARYFVSLLETVAPLLNGPNRSSGCSGSRPTTTPPRRAAVVDRRGASRSGRPTRGSEHPKATRQWWSNPALSRPSWFLPERWRTTSRYRAARRAHPTSLPHWEKSARLFLVAPRRPDNAHRQRWARPPHRQSRPTLRVADRSAGDARRGIDPIDATHQAH